jgi:RNA polymerase sigma factor (sigma-70 family)
MSEISQADSNILEEIRDGKAEAWSQFVEEYQSRLLNFAMARLQQREDTEDIVQDTFISFIRSLDNFRGEASLETYLFTILRNRIIDSYRTKAAKSVCLLQDVYNSGKDKETDKVFEQISSTNLTASWYFSRNEQYQLQHKALSQTLRKIIKGFQESLKFRNIKIAELLFYCNISNKDAAKILNLKIGTINAFKHRYLKQIRENVQKLYPPPEHRQGIFENHISEIWEAYRLSCPKRSTLGAFLLEVLEPKWFDYVDFHLTTLGCYFCRANFKDLRHQKTTDEQRLFRERIMASTVGFLTQL